MFHFFPNAMFNMRDVNYAIPSTPSLCLCAIHSHKEGSMSWRPTSRIGSGAQEMTIISGDRIVVIETTGL
jgi:hypothetical protein